MKKHRIARTIIATVLFFASWLTYADPAEQLNTLLRPLNSLEGRFQQTLIDGKGELLQESSGVFSLQRPGLFRWQTIEPFPQLLVSNRQRIWLYDEDLEQVIIRSYTQAMDKTPVWLLSGDPNRLSAYYHIAHRSENTESEMEKLTELVDNDDAFVLTSKSQGEPFAKIVLFFKNRQLSGMKLIDTLAQVSLFRFTRLKVNPILAADLFTFEPPPGIDIIVDD